MPLLEYVEATNRVFLLSEPRQIKEDWKIASCWWWGKYVPQGAKDEDLRAMFIDIHCGGLVNGFLALWQNRPSTSLISWTFPLNDATKLVIRAVSSEQGRAKGYLVIDLVTGAVGIAEDGTLHLSIPMGPPKPSQTAMVITPDRIPPGVAVEVGQNVPDLDAAAARVNSALQKLVGAASRAGA